jgi:capsular polysaccharide transport system permease protein
MGDFKDPVEYVEYYWKHQIDVEIDNLSSIITLRVRAFTPRDAYEIANFIISESEKIVNSLAERTRQDALRQTRTELETAELNLRNQVKVMRDLRNQEGTLDVDVTAQAIGTVITTLRVELAKLEETYQSSGSSVTKNAPQMKIMANRIYAVKKSITDYQAKLTSSSSNENTISEKSSKFATQQLAIDLAQKRYVSAAIAFEAAKTEINTQRIYLLTFSNPTVPEKALYPKRLLNWIIISLPAAALWGLGSALAFLIRDHAAG